MDTERKKGTGRFVYDKETQTIRNEDGVVQIVLGGPMKAYCAFCRERFGPEDQVYVDCDEQQADNSTPRYHRRCFNHKKRIASLEAQLTAKYQEIDRLREEQREGLDIVTHIQKALERKQAENAAIRSEFGNYAANTECHRAENATLRDEIKKLKELVCDQVRRNDNHLEARKILEEKIDDLQRNYHAEIHLCRYAFWTLHPGMGKYQDDGEMQCAGVDYKRGEISILIETTRKAIQRLALDAQERGHTIRRLSEKLQVYRRSLRVLSIKCKTLRAELKGLQSNEQPRG